MLCEIHAALVERAIRVFADSSRMDRLRVLTIRHAASVGLAVGVGYFALLVAVRQAHAEISIPFEPLIEHGGVLGVVGVLVLLVMMVLGYVALENGKRSEREKTTLANALLESQKASFAAAQAQAEAMTAQAQAINQQARSFDELRRVIEESNRHR